MINFSRADGASKGTRQRFPGTVSHRYEICRGLPIDHRKNRPRLQTRHLDTLSTTAQNSFGANTRQGRVLVVALNPTTAPVALPSSFRTEEKKEQEAHVLQSPRAAVAGGPERACDGEPISMPGWSTMSCSDNDTAA